MQWQAEAEIPRPPHAGFVQPPANQSIPSTQAVATAREMFRYPAKDPNTFPTLPPAIAPIHSAPQRKPPISLGFPPLCHANASRLPALLHRSLQKPISAERS